MLTHPQLAALAVVLHQGRLLLVRRRNEPDAGLWGYPGGRVELGETAMAAAARELLEETSVRAAPRAYLDNLDIILRDSTGDVSVHYLLAAVLCDYVEGSPVAADDVSDAAWVPFEEVRAGKIAMSSDVGRLLDLASSRASRPEPAGRAGNDCTGLA